MRADRINFLTWIQWALTASLLLAAVSYAAFSVELAYGSPANFARQELEQLINVVDLSQVIQQDMTHLNQSEMAIQAAFQHGLPVQPQLLELARAYLHGGAIQECIWLLRQAEERELAERLQQKLLNLMSNAPETGRHGVRNSDFDTAARVYYGPVSQGISVVEKFLIKKDMPYIDVGGGFKWGQFQRNIGPIGTTQAQVV